MKTKDFYKIYIFALEKAFQNDSINFGFYVKPPKDYLDAEIADQIDQYLEDHQEEFLNRIAYYFDAKSHNFPSIRGIRIDLYKKELMNEMRKLKITFY